MANVPCKEPGCPHLITDPCIKLEGLFILRKDLSDRFANTNEEEQQVLLNSVDQLLDKELGLNSNSSKVSLGLKRSEHLSDPILFTLKCIQGHVHQYLITCQA